MSIIAVLIIGTFMLHATLLVFELLLEGGLV